MQPLKTQRPPEKPLRHVRLERQAKTSITVEEGHSWAVSYSDMLMVLMSFFIIFSSFDDVSKEGKAERLSRIALEMQRVSGKNSPKKDNSSASSQQAGAGGSEGIGIGSGNITGGGQEQGMLGAKGQGGKYHGQVAFGVIGGGEPGLTWRQLSAYLKSVPFASQQMENDDTLLIHLSDHIYAPRDFSVHGRVQYELEQILKVLSPYRQELNITFIGHSDKLILQKGNRYLSNNFDLSSLRASRAMSFAVGYGFDPQALSIEGSASNLRDSRSLSLKLTAKPSH